MCGIVGYMVTSKDKYENARRGFLKYALVLDTLRGRDSTGVISITDDFKVERIRTLKSGFAFAPSKFFEDNVPNGWCMIGHNRAATVGQVTLKNAHPFKYGNISLVHNGALGS